ncbi:MAG: DUF1697 domain-containing protein [Gammaproteobacteria bacterium]|nr:DUF1697 domain-containing protein [Gammaproteobacteria bacterium]
MDTYVVLFKGINVGGKNLLSMKNLTAALEKNGYLNVKTYIQSGNVVLRSKQLFPGDISEIVSNNFGFKPEVLVLKKSDFLSSIKHNPFHPNEGKSAHFYFCSKKPKVNTDKLDKYIDDTEEYKLINKVFYLHAPKGIGRSRLVANIESCLGVSVTGRNLNTIRKLEEMVENA